MSVKRATVDPPAEGYRRVRVIYDPDSSRQGLVLDLPADEARARAAENRVALVADTTPLGDATDAEPTAAEPSVTWQPAGTSAHEPAAQ